MSWQLRVSLFRLQNHPTVQFPLNEIFDSGFDRFACIPLEILVLQTRIASEAFLLGFPRLDNQLFNPKKCGLVFDTSQCLQGINSLLDA